MARLIGLHGALLLLLTLAGIAVVVYKTHWNDFSSLSHYEALGVPETAQRKDIKRAFRDRSLQYHPDKASSLHSTELSTKRFHRISGGETPPDAIANG
ncbi:Chaperone dnaj, partial [Globisporangium splendens]